MKGVIFFADLEEKKYLDATGEAVHSAGFYTLQRRQGLSFGLPESMGKRLNTDSIGFMGYRRPVVRGRCMSCQSKRNARRGAWGKGTGVTLQGPQHLLLSLKENTNELKQAFTCSEAYTRQKGRLMNPGCAAADMVSPRLQGRYGNRSHLQWPSLSLERMDASSDLQCGHFFTVKALSKLLRCLELDSRAP